VTGGGLKPLAERGLRFADRLYRFSNARRARGLSEARIERAVIFCSYAGLGNMLMWLPALRAMHSRWPGIEITAVGPSEETAGLLINQGLIKRSYAFNPKTHKTLGEQLKFCARVIRRLRPRLCISNFIEPEPDASFWALVSGAGVRIGGREGKGMFRQFEAVNDPGVHEVEKNIRLLEPFNIGKVAPRARLIISGAVRRAAGDLLDEKGKGRWAGIHPGSTPGNRASRKRWPPDRYAEVARELVRQGWGVAVFCGPNDKDDVKEIKTVCGDDVLVIEDRPIGEVAAFISKMWVMITNDSGLMHVSCVTGVPVVALFGPTDSCKNRPWGVENIVLKGECEHAPCYLLPEAPCGGERTCLTGITPGDVLKAVERLVG